MKKFLGILVIAGVLVACNDSSETTINSDTLTTVPDTTGASALPPATTDTLAVDTSAHAADTAK